MVYGQVNISALYRLILVIFCGVSHTLTAQDHISDGMKKVYAMRDAVIDPEKQVGNFDPDSMPSLPIGIVKPVGESEVIIAIDSAYFLPDGAYFSAYMALDFPGSDIPLAFAAKDIRFNPKGITGGEQSKLMLVSQHYIQIGPNTRLLLPDDGSNYVNWSCNGFESVNLHGYFLFDDGILIPDPNSGDSLVTAEFEVNVTDIHNMMAMVNFSPFKVKGVDDFSFQVSEAYVDMSDYNNPLNAPMPQCYQQTYPDDINLWRGFYLRYFSVQLPEELNKSNNAVTIFASDMFIDDAGVTGLFGATNVFSTSENALNDEWGFSLDSISIGLTLNKITKGRMRGNVVIPPLDDASLIYTALISQNENNGLVDYSFSMSPSGPVGISCFNSTLTLLNSSKFEITRVNRKFKPKLTLNGNWQLDNPNWNFSGLGFEQFTLISEAPYVTQGYFSLITNGPPVQAANFPISLSNIGFGVINEQIVLGADIAFNLQDTTDNSFSASTGVKIYSNIARNPSTNKVQWQYDRFTLNTIYLAVMTSAVELVGFINFNDSHPVYGKGFYGGLQFKIPSIMENSMSMACAFGRVNGYRYWMVDATLPTNLAVGSITITSITGGIAYHMENTLSQAQLIGAVSPTANSGSTLAANYVPSEDAGLYFRAGVGFRNTLKEETLNGDVMFSVSFNSNGGLDYINFAGNAYMLCKTTERATSSNYAHGAVNINYDNQEKILDAQLTLVATFEDAMTADIWAQLYFSPGLWFVHLGKPSSQCTVNILNLASASGYFMLGQNLEPMPPPPPQVASVFNTMSDQRNEGSIASGNGVACGMSLSASFDKTLNITDNIYIYGAGYAGAGFDMTLYKYAPTTHCQGSSEPFGMNYWYLQGQLYAYMGLNIGAGWNNQDMTILEANTAMLLQGKMPKPSYVYGGVYIQASLFGLLDVSMTFDFDFGTNCVIVN